MLESVILLIQHQQTLLEHWRQRRIRRRSCEKTHDQRQHPRISHQRKITSEWQDPRYQGNQRRKRN